MPSGEWHFALKAADEVPNWSELSNSASTQVTNVVPPAAIDDLSVSSTTIETITLEWTASGADGDQGTAAQYDLRHSQEEITQETWKDATTVPGLPAPAGFGKPEQFEVTGLDPAATHFFALRVADEDGNWSELSNVLEAHTSNTFQLTFRPGDDGIVLNPSWSPDGSHIAFSASWEGNRDIWVIPAEGGQPTRISDDTGVDDQPTWSPDGTQIAFVSNRDSDFYGVWIVDAEAGATPRRLDSLPEDDLQHPTWSPDGEWIAYHTGRFLTLFTPTNLYRIPAGGGSRELLLAGDQVVVDPSWSPDGSRIALIRGQSMSWVLGSWNVAEETWTRILTTDSSVQNLDPEYSPNGTAIAFTSNWTREYEIYTIPATGGIRDLVSEGPGRKGAPTWSPDGTRIAYHSDRSGNYEVWVLHLD